MLRFKEELQRLQPYVEGWFSERGKSLPDWPKIYFVPVEGWFDYFNGHSDAAKLPDKFVKTLVVKYCGKVHTLSISLFRVLP